MRRLESGFVEGDVSNELDKSQYRGDERPAKYEVDNTPTPVPGEKLVDPKAADEKSQKAQGGLLDWAGVACPSGQSCALKSAAAFDAHDCVLQGFCAACGAILIADGWRTAALDTGDCVGLEFFGAGSTKHSWWCVLVVWNW